MFEYFLLVIQLFKGDIRLFHFELSIVIKFMLWKYFLNWSKTITTWNLKLKIISYILFGGCYAKSYQLCEIISFVKFTLFHKTNKQAELGVPHSKSKLSGPNKNCEVLNYFGSNKSSVQNEFVFQIFLGPKKFYLQF